MVMPCWTWHNIPEHLQSEENIGGTWTWIAIDADSKLIPSWAIPDKIERTRNHKCANLFSGA